MKKGMMRQVWLMGKGGPWKIKEVPIPTPGPGQLLVKMRACSICNQTDLNTMKALHPPHDHQMLGMLPHHFRIWDKRVPDELSDVYPARPYPREPFPTTMGHEGMGEIAEMGPFSEKHETLLNETPTYKVGDRVALVGNIGGFGEYVITEPSYTQKVPDNVSDEEASLFEPVTLVNTMVRQTVTMGDTVCILGQGALGLLATQLSKLYGASKIIVSDPIAMKRKLAEKFGADITIDPTTTNVVHEIEKLTDGKGVDVAIEAAGVPATIRMLPYIIGQGAIIGQIGACCVPVTVDWSYIHFKGALVTSVMAGMKKFGRADCLKRSMDLIASGKLNLKPMITHRYTLEEVDKAFKDVESGMVIKGVFIMK
ncbi:MAG: zinc-binding dehydrogenase [Candidatus Bathyarchaeia archaeon]